MALAINDKTVNPLLVTDGQSIAAYKGVTVTDTSALSNTETVSITLSQTLSQALGPNYYFYPTAANLGSISDPNGGGTWNAATETFIESGVIGGDPTFATNLLSRLLYNSPQLPNGQGTALQASITVTDGADVTTDLTPVIVGVVAPVAIGGTVPNEPIASGGQIRPFATTSITAPYYDYDYYTITAGSPYNTYTYGINGSYNAKDSATITITDGGKATDADGLLTGAGLSKIGVGAYSLGADYAYNINSELRSLSFQTVAVAAGQTSNPSFELDVTDTSSNLTSKDMATSLLVIGPSKLTAPIIAGTLPGQTVVPGNVLDPFASVTISDTNQAPTDSATITLTDASGKVTDANGTLTGTGLTETAAGSGIYTLAAASPANLTSALNALTFHPTALPGGVTSETTNFLLAVSDPVFATPATDNKTTVIETAPAVVNPPAPPGPPNNPQPIPASNSFDIQNETTGKSYSSDGEAYTGPVLGLSRDIILVTSDNVNVTAEKPNVFIKTGSGDDALNVSAMNGNNVLDGSTGSNFMVGGTGNDTFFVDDRTATSAIWSTVSGFHAGDAATVFGVTQTGFNLSWVDGQGAAGFTGLTLHATAADKPVASLTMVGFTSADLTNGKLSVMFGTESDGSGSYLYVKAN